MRRARTMTTVGAVALLLALAGCAGGGNDSPSAGYQEELADSPGDASLDGGSADEAAAAGSAEEPAEDGSPDADGSVSQTSLAAGRMQVVSAGLVVETDSVVTAAGRAETVAVGAGGLVVEEETRVDPITGDASSSLTLRVPPEAVDEVLVDLAALGDLVSQNRSTRDVTDEYVDVSARVASQRASLDRLLVLVGQAGALDDVIALEQEIARRQSDLDSLDARRQAIDGEVALATVRLNLTAHAEPVEADTEDAGFLSGLRSGWDAFTASVVALLTVVGALLPFAVLAAVVGVPLLLLLRHRRQQRPAPAE